MQEKTDRRSMLRILATGCLAAVGLPRLLGCAARVDETGPVTLDRAEAEHAGRTIVTWNEQPVEVRFTGDGFEARSLACTHLGCTVPWSETEKRFICPCHASSFDAAGRVLAAPATRPLDMLAVRVENGIVKVDLSRRTRRVAFHASQVTRP